MTFTIGNSGFMDNSIYTKPELVSKFLHEYQYRVTTVSPVFQSFISNFQKINIVLLNRMESTQGVSRAF